jgi:hypothetical protein
VEVFPDLWELIPRFLANRTVDLDKLRNAVAAGDVKTVRDLGHDWRGLGGGYGFDYISTAGRALEEMAIRGDLSEGKLWVDALADYLARVEPRKAESGDDEEEE